MSNLLFLPTFSYIRSVRALEPLHIPIMKNGISIPPTVEPCFHFEMKGADLLEEATISSRSQVEHLLLNDALRLADEGFAWLVDALTPKDEIRGLASFVLEFPVRVLPTTLFKEYERYKSERNIGGNEPKQDLKALGYLFSMKGDYVVVVDEEYLSQVASWVGQDTDTTYWSEAVQKLASVINHERFHLLAR